jgi:hypothetical protein
MASCFFARLMAFDQRLKYVWCRYRMMQKTGSLLTSQRSSATPNATAILEMGVALPWRGPSHPRAMGSYCTSRGYHREDRNPLYRSKWLRELPDHRFSLLRCLSDVFQQHGLWQGCRPRPDGGCDRLFDPRSICAGPPRPQADCGYAFNRYA